MARIPRNRFLSFFNQRNRNAKISGDNMAAGIVAGPISWVSVYIYFKVAVIRHGTFFLITSCEGVELLIVILNVQRWRVFVVNKESF